MASFFLPTSQIYGVFVDGVNVTMNENDCLTFNGSGGSAPVQSVAGKTGTVTLTHSDLTDWSTATSGFLTSAPVASVAGRTGTVTISHTDITDWASATSGFGGSSGVSSFSGRTGAITLLSADVTTALGFTPATAYSLPTASTSVLGGVKVDGTTVVVSGGVLSAAIPTASNSPPNIDGTAAAGASTAYARADHVHPTDTSRYAASNPSGFQTASQVSTSISTATSTLAPKASPTLTGTPLAPTATAGTSTTQLATTAYVMGQVSWFNVKNAPYGATGNGSTDDTTAIQAAITAAAAVGGDVIFPPGVYKITGTLTLGNGSSSTVSTWAQVRLIGIGKPPANAAILAGYDTEINAAKCAKLVWFGATGGTMIKVSGPLQGWGLENLWMDGANVAAYGVYVVSGQYGESANLTIKDCTSAAIYSTTVSALPSGVLNCDSLHNTWRNTVIGVSWTTGAKGIVLTGVVATGDTDYNIFYDTTIALPTTGVTSAYGVYMQAADSCMFINLHFLNGGASITYAVVYDYTLNADWPAACSIYGVDWGGLNGPVQAVGTPTGNGGPNPIYGLIEANQGTYPVNIPNLITPGGIMVKDFRVSQTASISLTTLLTAHNANLFRISYYLVCTGGTATGGTISVTYTWLDGSGTATFTSSTVPANGPGNHVNGAFPVWVPAAGTVSISASVSGVPSGTTQYAIYTTIERLA